MRIAGTSFTNSMVSQINLLAARQYQLQNQATTGQSIQVPSDNPAGMEKALNLQAESSTAAQYAQNISTLQDRANLTASALSHLKTISDQVTQIATQAANGTNSAAQMQTYATQVTSLIKQAAQVMNSKSGSQYLFGGTANGQPPYAVATDANGNVTGVTYQGNSSVAQNAIAANTTLSVDLPGANTSGAGPRGVITDSRSGADFFNHLLTLQSHLAAGNTNAVSTTDQPALAHDEDNIIYQVANNGVALSQLNAAATAASTQQTNLQQNISQVADANLTQTLVDLSQAQNSYQVALQSSSKMLQLQTTLLNAIQ